VKFEQVYDVSKFVVTARQERQPLPRPFGGSSLGAMSAFADANAIPPQQIWDGLLARTVHGNRMTLTLIELEPGTAVPEHSHENEQMGVLLQGSMTFTIGEETKELGPGATWTILAHVPHGVVAGPEGSVLVEVFSPVRHDWQAREQLDPRPGRWP
jgi:quercetin dioxygenase-like cupin family protein